MSHRSVDWYCSSQGLRFRPVCFRAQGAFCFLSVRCTLGANERTGSSQLIVDEFVLPAGPLGWLLLCIQLKASKPESRVMSEGFRTLKRAKHSLLVTSLATRVLVPILFFMKFYGHLT